MAPAPRIQDHFNARAPRYDNPLTAFIGERELRQIRPWLVPGAQVLDFGCGTGRTTLHLLRLGCRVTAYDLSPGMLAIAAQRAASLGAAAEFTSDPARLQGRTWPLITCIGVLDYYPDPLPMLRELRALLQPGGRLIVTYPNAHSPLGWLYALGSRLTFPARPRTAAFARQAAERVGLAVEGVRYAFPALRPVGHTVVVAMKSG
jgi:2-polyprenyl-3-methyl-5-hydroxy-6-metoxy-1,4-benzoquinol methylase